MYGASDVREQQCSRGFTLNFVNCPASIYGSDTCVAKMHGPHSFCGCISIQIREQFASECGDTQSDSTEVSQLPKPSIEDKIALKKRHAKSDTSSETYKSSNYHSARLCNGRGTTFMGSLVFFFFGEAYVVSSPPQFSLNISTRVNPAQP